MSTVGNSFQTQIEGLTDLTRRMGPDAVRVVATELTAGVQEATEATREQTNALINRRTQGPGAGLRESATVQVRAGRREVIGIVEWTAPYAKFVEYGRGMVYPVRAKVLAIVLPGAQMIFRKFARPMPGQFFTVRGTVWAGPAAARIIENRMQRVARFLDGGGA